MMERSMSSSMSLEELKHHASLLFIDPLTESHLTYLVPKFIQAPLPEGWIATFDDRGIKVFYNNFTGHASRYHPLSYYFAEVANVERISAKAPGPAFRTGADGEIIVDREVIDYLSKDAATLQDVRTAMDYLGIDYEDEGALIRLAIQYYLAPLPDGWRRIRTVDSLLQFFNIDTGTESKLGPLFSKFKNKARTLRAMIVKRTGGQAGGATNIGNKCEASDETQGNLSGDGRSLTSTHLNTAIESVMPDNVDDGRARDGGGSAAAFVTTCRRLAQIDDEVELSEWREFPVCSDCSAISATTHSTIVIKDYHSLVETEKEYCSHCDAPVPEHIGVGIVSSADESADECIELRKTEDVQYDLCNASNIADSCHGMRRQAEKNSDNFPAIGVVSSHCLDTHTDMAIFEKSDQLTCTHQDSADQIDAPARAFDCSTLSSHGDLETLADGTGKTATVSADVTSRTRGWHHPDVVTDTMGSAACNNEIFQRHASLDSVDKGNRLSPGFQTTLGSWCRRGFNRTRKLANLRTVVIVLEVVAQAMRTS